MKIGGHWVCPLCERVVQGEDRQRKRCTPTYFECRMCKQPIRLWELKQMLNVARDTGALSRKPQK